MDMGSTYLKNNDELDVHGCDQNGTEMKSRSNARSCHAICASVFSLAIGSYSPVVSAGFELNFLPDASGVMATAVTHGSSINIFNQTPYLMSGGFQLPEIVIDPETGLDYYHIIVGDAADGFIQEVYIERGFGSFPNSNVGSAVGGAGDLNGGNGVDPLDRNANIETANAAANPNKVLVRQLMNDGEIQQEYIKSEFNKKAKITQIVTDPVGMVSRFEIDSSNVMMNQLAAPGTMINTLDLAGTEYDFDMATISGEGVDINVNAGQYIYLDGIGPGGSAGTYLYLDGGEDVSNTDWESYYDVTENNPWTYTANQPN